MKMMKKVILAESPVNIWVVKYGTDDKLNADILMGIWYLHLQPRSQDTFWSGFPLISRNSECMDLSRHRAQLCVNIWIEREKNTVLILCCGQPSALANLLHWAEKYNLCAIPSFGILISILILTPSFFILIFTSYFDPFLFYFPPSTYKELCQWLNFWQGCSMSGKGAYLFLFNLGTLPHYLAL